MRLLALLAIGLLAGGLMADDKKDEKKPEAYIDAKLLVGTWKGQAVGIVIPKTNDGKNYSLVEFTADGAIRLRVVSADDTSTVTVTAGGKYTLDGATLTIVTHPGKADESKSVATVTKLTDTELEWINSNKKTETFKRVKDEKKDK